MTRKNFTLLSLILIAAFSRLIPHWPNVTAVTAMALLAGAHLKHRWTAVAVPLMALFVSDLVLGFHETMPFVYAAFALVTLLGSVTLASVKPVRLAGTTLISSLVFFLITNTGVWWVGEIYPRTAQGLAASYVAALPFLRNQIVGDLIFTGLVFAAYYGIVKHLARESSAKAQA